MSPSSRLYDQPLNLLPRSHHPHHLRAHTGPLEQILRAPSLCRTNSPRPRPSPTKQRRRLTTHGPRENGNRPPRLVPTLHPGLVLHPLYTKLPDPPTLLHRIETPKLRQRHNLPPEDNPTVTSHSRLKYKNRRPNARSAGLYNRLQHPCAKRFSNSTAECASWPRSIYRTFCRACRWTTRGRTSSHSPLHCLHRITTLIRLYPTMVHLQFRWLATVLLRKLK
jgi:hypothetical protein